MRDDDASIRNAADILMHSCSHIQQPYWHNVIVSWLESQDLQLHRYAVDAVERHADGRFWHNSGQWKGMLRDCLHAILNHPDVDVQMTVWRIWSQTCWTSRIWSQWSTNENDQNVEFVVDITSFGLVTPDRLMVLREMAKFYTQAASYAETALRSESPEASGGSEALAIARFLEDDDVHVRYAAYEVLRWLLTHESPFNTKSIKRLDRCKCSGGCKKRCNLQEIRWVSFDYKHLVDKPYRAALYFVQLERCLGFTASSNLDIFSSFETFQQCHEDPVAALAVIAKYLQHPNSSAMQQVAVKMSRSRVLNLNRVSTQERLDHAKQMSDSETRANFVQSLLWNNMSIEAANRLVNNSILGVSQELSVLMWQTEIWYRDCDIQIPHVRMVDSLKVVADSIATMLDHDSCFVKSGALSLLKEHSVLIDEKLISISKVASKLRDDNINVRQAAAALLEGATLEGDVRNLLSAVHLEAKGGPARPDDLQVLGTLPQVTL